MKILIICSKAFYKDIAPIKEKLEQLGHEISLPNSYHNPQAEKESWDLGEKEHSEFKAKMFRMSKERISKIIGLFRGKGKAGRRAYGQPGGIIKEKDRKSKGRRRENQRQNWGEGRDAGGFKTCGRPLGGYKRETEKTGGRFPAGKAPVWIEEKE